MRDEGIIYNVYTVTLDLASSHLSWEDCSLVFPNLYEIQIRNEIVQCVCNRGYIIFLVTFLTNKTKSSRVRENENLYKYSQSARNPFLSIS